MNLDVDNAAPLTDVSLVKAKEHRIFTSSLKQEKPLEHLCNKN